MPAEVKRSAPENEARRVPLAPAREVRMVTGRAVAKKWYRSQPCIYL